MVGSEFYGPPSGRRDLVPSASKGQPSGSNHLLRSLEAASRVSAARSVEPAISGD
jgi:hypothetical protein